MTDDFLFDDVSHIEIIIYSHITFVLRIHPRQGFKRIDDHTILRNYFSGETAIGIFDEDGAINMCFLDCLIDGLRLRDRRVFQYHYLRFR